MKDYLEKFIQDHREAFDSHDPDPGLWKTIDQSGKKTKKIRKINWYKTFTRIAAVIVIFFASYFVQKLIQPEGTIPVMRQAGQIEPKINEIQEAKAYYTSKMSNKFDEINEYIKDDKKIVEEILADFEELDHEFAELQEDLQDNVDNKIIIEAMIRNYKTKLTILEEILNELKDEHLSNKPNTKYHEKYHL